MAVLSTTKASKCILVFLLPVIVLAQEDSTTTTDSTDLTTTDSTDLTTITSDVMEERGGDYNAGLEYYFDGKIWKSRNPHQGVKQSIKVGQLTYQDVIGGLKDVLQSVFNGFIRLIGLKVLPPEQNIRSQKQFLNHKRRYKTRNWGDDIYKNFGYTSWKQNSGFKNTIHDLGYTNTMVYFEHKGKNVHDNRNKYKEKDMNMRQTFQYHRLPWETVTSQQDTSLETPQVTSIHKEMFNTIYSKEEENNIITSTIPLTPWRPITITPPTTAIKIPRRSTIRTTARKIKGTFLTTLFSSIQATPKSMPIANSTQTSDSSTTAAATRSTSTTTTTSSKISSIIGIPYSMAVTNGPGKQFVVDYKMMNGGLTTKSGSHYYDVFEDYFENEIRVVDIDEDVVIQACVSNSKVLINKIDDSYGKCFKDNNKDRDYDLNEFLENNNGHDEDNDGLSDVYEANEACFYKEMGWVTNNKAVKEVIKKDFENLNSNSVKKEFISNIEACSSWNGKFKEKKKREAEEERWAVNLARKRREAKKENGNEIKQVNKVRNGKGPKTQNRKAIKNMNGKGAKKRNEKGAKRRNFKGIRKQNGKGNKKRKGNKANQRKGKRANQRNGKGTKKGNGKRTQKRNGRGGKKGKDNGIKKLNGKGTNKRKENKLRQRNGKGVKQRTRTGTKKGNGKEASNRNKNGSRQRHRKGAKKLKKREKETLGEKKEKNGTGKKRNRKNNVKGRNGKNKNGNGKGRRKSKTRKDKMKKGKGKGRNGKDNKINGKARKNRNGLTKAEKKTLRALLPENVYNQLWCYEVSMEKALEDCVVEKLLP